MTEPGEGRRAKELVTDLEHALERREVARLQEEEAADAAVEEARSALLAALEGAEPTPAEEEP